MGSYSALLDKYPRVDVELDGRVVGSYRARPGDLLGLACEACDGSGIAEERHDHGAVEALGCQDCQGSGRVVVRLTADPVRVGQHIRIEWELADGG